jgi:succinate dehydrogenase / fumarate reductase, cytochrome b subunit
MSHSTFTFASISKKVITALAGLFLITFLAVHLFTNLLMLLPDNGETFRQAVHFLATNPVIKIMEIVLFAGFIIHIVLGFVIAINNWVARPVGYKVAQKSYTYFMSKYMFHTGVIIFVFLLIHLWSFYAIKIGLAPQPDIMEDKHDFYPLAIQLFQQPLFSAFYLISFIFLGFHLSHALQSAFQTLGLNHSRYTPTVKVISTLYAIIISAGFAVIPIYFLFIFKG